MSRLGLEPRTPALKGQCSTIELPAHIFYFHRVTAVLQFTDLPSASFGVSSLQDRRDSAWVEGIQFPDRMKFVG